MGHIEYFKDAKKYAKYLYVILNNDFQVKLKGSIPFQTLEERIKIVSSIKYVDAVIPSIDFDLSVAETLKSIKPDYFFNSGDRDINNANPKEIEVCKEFNIHTIYKHKPKIQSSSNLIENAAKEWIRRNNIK
jgi:cytidyltransferase-like protein